MTYRFKFYPETAHSFEIFDVYDEEGDVARFGRDSHTKIWWVVAEPARFPSLDSLPGIFGGRFMLHFERLDDVYRMFGVPLPSAVVVEQRSAA